MDKTMNVAMALVILITIAIGLNAFRDLNDGRVLTVVKQLTAPKTLKAQATTLKRTK